MDYSFSFNGSYTSSQVATYTSKVGSNDELKYTYTYDGNGNITKITCDGKEIRYVYDDLGQLIREDNAVRNQTYVYTYDKAGNILSKKTYTLTAAGSTPTSPTSTNTYGYNNANWGDLLTSFNGKAITYDAIGNPLSYNNGSQYSLEWSGRRLTKATLPSSSTVTYTYNDEGIRTSKNVSGTEYRYSLNGSQIVSETWGSYLFVYLYDADGSPIGMQCRVKNMAEGQFYTFWFEKNLQGDIVAVYDDAGNKLYSYAYDAWGNSVATRHSTSTAARYAQYNPFRYRGYYYDTETGFYYLQSRYYDPNTGRFLNADGQLNGGLLGYNQFAYCENNPVMGIDPTGNWPRWIEDAANWVDNNIIQPIKKFIHTSKRSNIAAASFRDANRRPYKGKPGSTYIAPNGDSRTYGPDGTPEHDYDHDDHGRPDKHPHDPNGGHNHDWENGVRGPAYSIGWEPVVGVALVTVCAIGIFVVAADDATGIGVADDFLLGPLGAGAGEGLILIFG